MSCRKSGTLLKNTGIAENDRRVARGKSWTVWSIRLYSAGCRKLTSAGVSRWNCTLKMLTRQWYVVENSEKVISLREMNLWAKKRQWQEGARHVKSTQVKSQTLAVGRVRGKRRDERKYWWWLRKFSTWSQAVCTETGEQREGREMVRGWRLMLLGTAGCGEWHATPGVLCSSLKNLAEATEGQKGHKKLWWLPSTGSGSCPDFPSCKDGAETPQASETHGVLQTYTVDSSLGRLCSEIPPLKNQSFGPLRILTLGR